MVVPTASARQILPDTGTTHGTKEIYIHAFSVVRKKKKADKSRWTVIMVSLESFVK